MKYNTMSTLMPVCVTFTAVRVRFLAVSIRERTATAGQYRMGGVGWRGTCPLPSWVQPLGWHTVAGGNPAAPDKLLEAECVL